MDNVLKMVEDAIKILEFELRVKDGKIFDLQCLITWLQAQLKDVQKMENNVLITSTLCEISGIAEALASAVKSIGEATPSELNEALLQSGNEAIKHINRMLLTLATELPIANHPETVQAAAKQFDAYKDNPNHGSLKGRKSCGCP